MINVFSRKDHSEIHDAQANTVTWQEPKIKKPSVTPAISGTEADYEKYRESYKNYVPVIPGRLLINAETKNGTLLVTSPEWSDWLHGRTDNIPVKITNGDHIRSMSDEDMAKFLQSAPNHSPKFLCEGSYHTSCKSCWESWLGETFNPEDEIW